MNTPIMPVVQRQQQGVVAPLRSGRCSSSCPDAERHHAGREQHHEERDPVEPDAVADPQLGSQGIVTANCIPPLSGSKAHQSPSGEHELQRSLTTRASRLAQRSAASSTGTTPPAAGAAAR